MDIDKNKTVVVTARQPILSEDLEVYGYEFFSRASIQDQESTIKHTVQSDSTTIFNLFSNFNLDTLLRGKKAFLNCILELNDSLTALELLNNKSVLLEVSAPTDPENQVLIDGIYEKMAELKKKGFTLVGSELVFQEKYKKWFDVVSVIKFTSINPEGFSKEALQELLQNVNLAKKFNKKIVAEKVETRSQFEILKRLKFDYYQGYFFAKPVNLSSKITNPSLGVMIRLINLVNADADINELEAVIKTDPTVAFKLLRYLNAVGVGGGEKVESFKRALMILGHKKLLKWLTILFSSVNTKKGMDAISKMALIRGRLMELIAIHLGEKDSDSYFITGLFSMLDSMLDIDLDISINSIDVAEEIKDAVLRNSGKYSKLLNLTKKLENAEWVDIFAILYEFGIPTEFFNEKYLEAAEWAETLNAS